MIAALVLIALTATACAGFGPVGHPAAAEVDGTRISSQQVFALLNAQKRGAGSSGSAGNLLGSGRSDTFQMSSFGSALSALIRNRLVMDALHDKGVRVTDAQRTEARQQLEDQAGGAAELKKYDENLVNFTIESGAAQMALRDTLVTPDPAQRERDLRAAYDQTKGDNARICVSAVFTKTQAEANEVKRKLDDGADFATLAKDSVEPQSAAQGGNLGCGTLSQVTSVVPSLTVDAQNGDLIGPEQTAALQGQDWIVAKVDSIQIPTFDQMKAQLEQSVPAAGQTELANELGRLSAKADITVASKFGTWDAKTASVVPPAGSNSATTTSTVPTGAGATGAGGATTTTAPSGAG